MNKCSDTTIQEMLPDLLHRTLSADARERVETHLATCEECREEVEVLRTVMSAAVFAPTIEVDGVVRRILPYQKITPTVEFPARPRVVSWLVAAGLVIAVAGVGSLLVTRQNATQAPATVVTATPAVQAPTQPTSIPSKTPETPTSRRTGVAAIQPHAHALALAADVDGLSDGNLVQLMNDMTRFDALPATEPDPVISVDTGYNLEQDLR
jgi:putative zinc finger protein